MREEEKKRSSQDSSVKRFLKKRWAFPAIYIASAAIILTAVLWYQNGANNASDEFDYEATDIAGKKYNEPAVEVNRTMENFAMPVANPDEAVIQKQFYDDNASKEQQEAALVFYNNTYHPNTGIDITMKDGKSFDVVAALSGTVTKVNEDSLLGNVIEIEHEKGIVTQYQSVKDFAVKVGDQVEQGQVLATAGESLFNGEAGQHVHFEIRKDGVAVNPIDFFQKPLSALQEYKPEDNSEAANTGDEEGEGQADENATDEEGSKEEESESGEREDKSEDDKQSDEESGDEESSDTSEESSNTNG
ncbi:M23 family metallopeptidase [Cytobacillus spongiae]|uniref:M23 family metallopeptidase n=1 Tax=Cytobacillus spongiae TaxID=2901381 RepID=UPI001F36873D|nr:M23 family metallopeptidase [Cytobacillus spongiae]UII55719.1 M23 family metallopeptidase [Cytobacillus spongiae]